MAIGKWVTSAYYHDGSMSHFTFIDGTAYDATAFGEYDANGVWKIKTSPSVTYGTNGFFILKDGNQCTDQSGNSNNFTVGGGTLTNTEDNPSNVFATLNRFSITGINTFRMEIIQYNELLQVNTASCIYIRYILVNIIENVKIRF